jgi:hypothetical protein
MIKLDKMRQTMRVLKASRKVETKDAYHMEQYLYLFVTTLIKLERGIAPAPKIRRPMKDSQWRRIKAIKEINIPDRARPHIEFALSQYQVASKLFSSLDKARSKNREEGRVAKDLERARKSLERYHKPLREKAERLRVYSDSDEEFDNFLRRGTPFTALEEMLREAQETFAAMAKGRVGHRTTNIAMRWLVFYLAIILLFYRPDIAWERSKAVRAFVVEVLRIVEPMPKETSADQFIVLVGKIVQAIRGMTTPDRPLSDDDKRELIDEVAAQLVRREVELKD